MAKLSPKDSRRRWFASANRATCAPCSGQKRPARLKDSIVQTPFVCPKCGRAWMYKINPVLPVAQRVVHWWYVPGMEPFPVG